MPYGVLWGFRTAAFLSYMHPESPRCDAGSLLPPPAGHGWGGGRAEPVLSSGSCDCYRFFSLYFLSSPNVDAFQEQDKEPDQWAFPQDRGSANFSSKEFNNRNLGSLWAQGSFNITQAHNRIHSSTNNNVLNTSK